MEKWEVSVFWLQDFVEYIDKTGWIERKVFVAQSVTGPDYWIIICKWDSCARFITNMSTYLHFLQAHNLQ